jgi:NH3-dependent NAD+ synthetase
MALRKHNPRGWQVATGLALLSTFVGLIAIGFAKELTIQELKDRVAGASGGERSALCIEIAERELDAADRLYAADDIDKAQASLVDVAAFSEQARDYAIQSHKREKQSEIAIRKMTRKLENLKHSVAREDQKTIQETIDHLQRVRDDLLTAMFPNGVKK